MLVDVNFLFLFFFSNSFWQNDGDFDTMAIEKQGWIINGLYLFIFVIDLLI
jgi:hypothetical protein